MDTHGHHRVLQQSAEPRLRRAFAEKQVEGYNTNALFLGNWLADLSQLNDPASTLVSQLSRDLAELRGRRAAVTAQLTTKVGAALTAASAKAMPAPGDSTLMQQLCKFIAARVEELLGSIFALFDTGPGSGPPIGTTLISMVRVLGYLKFAVPESNAERLRIDYPAYAKIFKDLCRQYFPHEHMDRPLCSASYGPPCEAQWGEQYQQVRDRLYASGRSRSGDDPHMYSYLVDSRTIIAGRLAELDLCWASRDLVSGRPSGTPVKQAERDLALARLGHTLHSVEDFFAHSTFVEHAVADPEKPHAMNTVLYGRSARPVGAPAGTDIAASKVARRLRRYNPDLYEVDAEIGAAEDALATGYFDGWDTLNAGLHFLEEIVRPTLLGLERRQRLGDVGEVFKNVLETYAGETVTDVIDMFALVVPRDADSWDVQVHRAIAGLVEYLQQAALNGDAVTVQTVAGRAGTDPVLRLLPPELVRDALGPAVLGLIAGARGAKTGWTIYQAAKACAEFRQNPTGYLLKPLTTEATEFVVKFGLRLIADLIGKDLLVELNYVLISELQQVFRADRIGCHSLLAKDQPTEPLYDEMFRCARHVDWFIVDTLCRWSDSAWLTNTKEDRKWVRWDELIAHHLRAPVDIAKAPRRRVQWRRASELRRQSVSGLGETLLTAYQRLVATVGSGLETADYEDFVAANLGLASGAELLRASPVAGMTLDSAAVTELIIASGLAHRAPNGHELRPGIQLALPVFRTIGIDVVETTSWYRDVIGMSDANWQSSIEAYELTRWTESPQFGHYRLSYLAGASRTEIQRDLGRFITFAANIRTNLEGAYGPWPSRNGSSTDSPVPLCQM